MNKTERTTLREIVRRIRLAQDSAPDRAVYRAGGTAASVAAQLGSIARDLEAVIGDEQPDTTDDDTAA